MIVWTDGGHGARENMRRDAELLVAAASGDRREAVLRLFTFRPAGITLGRGQDPARELDLEACARDGIEWAVRPTGGRTIFHDEEWTFSLTAPLTREAWAATPREAYARTGSLFAEALASLGVPAVLAPGGARGPGAPRLPDGAAPPCFASTARHELTIEGRKLAGIAQRAARGAILQQGSLLLGDSHVRLAHYLRATEAGREALAALLARETVSAGRWIGEDHAIERLGDAVVARLDGAVRVFGGDRPVANTWAT